MSDLISNFSLGLPVNHPSRETTLEGLSQTTKELELLARSIGTKLNDVITALNSTARRVCLPIPWIQLTASATFTVYNFRIPTNYKAAIIHASVASIPASQVTLSVVHSPSTYGTMGSGATSREVLTTQTEVATETEYFSAGELVLRLTNSATSKIDAVASVLLDFVSADAVQRQAPAAEPIQETEYITRAEVESEFIKAIQSGANWRFKDGQFQVWDATAYSNDPTKPWRPLAVDNGVAYWGAPVAN